MQRFLLLVVAGVTMTLAGAEPLTKKTAREALQAFNDQIGSWRGTGIPEGTRAEKERAAWSETVAWEWRFAKDDARLTLAFTNGKYFTGGELTYLPATDRYQLTLTTVGKETQRFEGTLTDKTLTLERDAGQGETQRLVFRLLHANRYLCNYEVKPPGKDAFRRVYQVGATKKGEPFATAGTAPECVVSGGAASIAVMYRGQTYYVCCGGCRDAFKAEPEKFIKEYEAKRKGK